MTSIIKSENGLLPSNIEIVDESHRHESGSTPNANNQPVSGFSFRQGCKYVKDFYFEKQSERSHENTEPSPPDTSELKRHAIEFCKWFANRVSTECMEPEDVEIEVPEYYNEFLSRK